jgi:hypothetical protein
MPIFRIHFTLPTTYVFASYHESKSYTNKSKSKNVDACKTRRLALASGDCLEPRPPKGALFSKRGEKLLSVSVQQSVRSIEMTFFTNLYELKRCPKNCPFIGAVR